MSYIFLLDQAGVSSAESFSDIPASVLSRLNLTAVKSCSKDSETESFQSSQSGMTLGRSMEILGADQLTLFAVDSRARTSVVPEKEMESVESGADYGRRWQEWYAKWDQESCSWKTPHYLLDGGLGSFSGIFTNSGMMLDGECFQLERLVPTISESESTSWPTPSGVRGKAHCVGAISEWGGSQNPFRGTSDRNLRCPDFEEWMMGWPESWTAPMPYAMDKFQRWLNLHGKI